MKKYSLVLFIMVLVLVGGFSFLVPKVHAAVPTVSTLVTADVGGTGTINRLILTLSEDISGTTNGTGFTLSGGGTCSISSASESSAGVMTFVLSSCTAGTDVRPSLAYSSVTGDLISVSTSDPLATFTATQATDDAAPIISPAFTVNNITQPDTVIVTASEPLNLSESQTTTNWTVANNAGTITYTIASAVLSGAGNNIVTLTLATVAPATAATFITNAAATAHIKVTMGAGIHDRASVPIASAATVVTGASETLQEDSTAATVNATLVKNSVTTFTVTFSEKVDKTTAETLNKYTLSGTCPASTGNPSVAALQSNGVDVLLTVPTTAGCNVTGSSTVIVTPAASITDVAGVAITSSAATITLPDTTAPTLSSWTLNMNTGHAVLTFSEAVKDSTLAVTGITVQNAATATGSNTVTLTDSATATSNNGTTVDIALSATDLNAIKAKTGLAKAIGTSYIVITSAVIDDMATVGNHVTAIADGAAQNVGSYTADSTAPTLAESVAITSSTNTTPSYTFTSNEPGTIAYSGDCSSETTSASSGSNTITFFTLPVGTHSNCIITVTDMATIGNVSTRLGVTSFAVISSFSGGSASSPASNTTPPANPSIKIDSGATTPNEQTPKCAGVLCANNNNKNTPASSNKPEVMRTYTFTKTLGASSKVIIISIQKALNAALPKRKALNTDGKAGPSTLAAIRAFQTANKLKPDGVLGAKTRVALSKIQFAQ